MPYFDSVSVSVTNSNLLPVCVWLLTKVNTITDRSLLEKKYSYEVAQFIKLVKDGDMPGYGYDKDEQIAVVMRSEGRK